MSRLRLTAMIAVVLAELAIPTVGVAGAASAGSGKWETFHEEFSFVEEDGCGVPASRWSTPSWRTVETRVTAHGTDGLPYYATHEEVAQTVAQCGDWGVCDRGDEPEVR